MKDRFMNGLIAGIIAGIFALIIDLFFVDVLKFGKLRFWDFSSILLFGNKPQSFWQTLLGILGHIGFSGIGGVIYAYLIRLITSKYLYIKGIVFGLSIWFSAYTTTYMLKVPYLKDISFETSVADYISSLFYGLILTYVLVKLVNKTTFTRS